ncbi:MAG: FAD:protein FMN transferase [Clostridia bacterium]|nr:FAD:protein FMN transferase [Clostridia bacterium]
MKKLAAALFALALLLTGCTGESDAGHAPTAAPTAAVEPSAAPAMTKYSTVFMDTFDTVIQVIGYAESEAVFSTYANQVYGSYLYMHKLFDNYNSYEDEGIVSVYTLNQRAAQEPVKVDPILFHLLDFCRKNYGQCRGQVNIAMGSVLSIWHDYREAGLNSPEQAQLPPMDELTAAAAHTDINNLILDEENMTVFFADPSMKLDVGAAAKGYATEIAAKLLLDSELSSFIISAGGNVRVGNPPRDGRANWGVGIQDPDGSVLGTSDIIETLFLSNKSVVTSGDYQRFYTVDGVNYHHLIDPDTLMPSTEYRSVSIITEDSGYADLLSTTAFLMPYEESRTFIESLDGVEAIWVFPDMHIEMTDGAKPYAKSQGAANK